MNDVKLPREHDEIDLLLPWYVNGTLEANEQERIAAHLQSCPDCQANVELLSEVQAAVATNKTTPIVLRPRINDLLDAINGRKQPNRSAGINYLVAAGVVLALTTTLIVIDRSLHTGIPATFETATSAQKTTAMDYVLRIEFSPGVTRSAQQDVLQEIGAREVSVSDSDGSYRVVVQLQAGSLEALNRYTTELEARPQVAAVEVIALQLPMKSNQ